MLQRSARVRTLLSVYASGLAILLALAIGVLLVQGTGSLTSRVARFSLGVSLIGAAIFASIFSSLATWVLDRNQRASLEETLESSREQIITNVSVLRQTYLPVAEFPALDTFGESFNRALMASIETSPIYDFCGPSARYVAARLRKVRHCPGQIRVSMIDPALDSAIMRRAADREKWASSAGKSLAELERELREELRMTIVSLFDFRTTCPVRIVYTGDLVVYRMELTRGAVFFSWYHGPASSGKEMPEAVQFGSDSIYYQVLSEDMNRRFEVLPRKILFDSSHTEGDLISHLGQLTGIPHTADDLMRLRRQYSNSTKGFTEFLGRLGY
jgi:hypothetical protein